MRTKIITTQLIILFLSSILIMAQDEDKVKDKLKRIKGEVNKIVVSTENGDVVFEGKEAKQLLKKMKTKKHSKMLKWVSEDGADFDIDSEDDNVMIFKSKKGGKHIIKEIKGADNVLIFEHSGDDDLNIIKDKKMINVEVNDDNGEKTVTVTTTEDGEEKVETYKGEEADEYLDKMEDEHEMIIDIDMDEGSDGENVWIHSKGEGDRIEKNVEVVVEDGVKKVTVKTIKEGKETVEVFEGDEADEYFKSENGSKMKIKVKKLKDGKRKKVIIKELKKVDENK